MGEPDEFIYPLTLTKCYRSVSNRALPRPQSLKFGIIIAKRG